MPLTRITSDNISNNSISLSDISTSEGALYFRNLLINGNFEVWQRSTSQTSTGYGSADRWKAGIVGSSCTFSRQSFTVGQTDVPNDPTYFMRAVVTSSSGASNYVLIQQPIEGVRTLQNKTATLSFWAKADSNKNIAIELNQSFGTGGSPSSTVTDIGEQLVALTTTWTKYTITVNVPSISGKTIGTNNNDSLILNFWFDAGSSFNSRTASLGQQSGTFDISQIQFEEGSTATAFEVSPKQLIKLNCERYYKVGKTQRNFATSTNFGAYGTCEAFIGVAMRTTPTIVVSGYTSGTLNRVSYFSGSWTDTTVYTVTVTSDHSFFAQYNNSQRTEMGYQWTADAEL